MGNQRSFRAIFKTIGKIFLGFILSSCILFIVYFHLLREIDLSICMHQVSKNVDIDPNYPALRNYLQKSLAPGMTRQDVQETLERIGPIQVFNLDKPGEIVTNKIVLKKCHHPINQFTIYIRYTPEGVLASIFIDDDS